MTREEPMGLVVSGAVRDSFVARLPALLAQLGPVAGTSYPLARRTVKALRAGYAVSHYSALEMCPVIWIAAPECRLERIVGDLAAQTPMHRTAVVLCGTMQDSDWPAALHDAGARIATLNQIEESGERAFVIEGHPDAVRTVRKLLAEDQRRSVQIRADTKALYFAGIRLAKDLLLPPVAASVECLRAAGFQRTEALEVVQALGAHTLNGFAKTGKKASAGAALFADALRFARQPARSEIRSTGQLVRAERAGQGRVP
jgi:hypothetical protein